MILNKMDFFKVTLFDGPREASFGSDFFSTYYEYADSEHLSGDWAPDKIEKMSPFTFFMFFCQIISFFYFFFLFISFFFIFFYF
jgi:hypothetical protein